MIPTGETLPQKKKKKNTSTYEKYEHGYFGDSYSKLTIYKKFLYSD